MGVSQARAIVGLVGDRVIRLVLALVALVGVCFAGAPARALDLTRGITQLHHTAWTLRDGMPPNVSAIAQTRDGYLWIGGSSGLYRFDGIRLEPYGPRLPGGAVITLAATPSGDLWIGSTSGISRLSRGRLTTFSVPGLGHPSGIKHIALGRNGEVWVATDKVARFDGRRWQVMDSDWGVSDLYRKPGGVWGLAVARDGVVWTKNLLGLYFLRPGSTRFVRAEGYGGSIVDFARAADGRLWTADSASQRFYALPDLGPSGPPPPPAQVGAAVPPGALGRVMFDRDGALWCANAVTGTLLRLRSITTRHADVETFTPADGLTLGTPARVFEDTEGDVWVGTSTGLNRFAPANVVAEPSISIRSMGAEITASNDAVYVADGWPPPAPATGHGVQKIYAITDGAPRALSIPVGDVTVLNAQGSDVLVGSRQALVRLRDGVATTIPLPKGATGGDLVSAKQQGDDLWAIIGERGLFRRRGDAWIQVTAAGLETIPTTRLRIDRQGAVWLFDEERIRRFTGDRLDVFSAASGPDIGGTNAFVSDPRGVLLAGDQGVSWFDGRRFHTLSRRQAPFLTVVLGVVADDVGGTWFHTGAGIYRVSTRQLEQAFRDPAVRLDGQLFDARDGLRSTGTVQQFGGSAVRGPDGRLWFLNDDNVAWIDPHRLYRNPVPPPVSIRSLTVEGRVLDPAGVRKLAAGVSDLQIDYTALSLQNPDRVKFRYRLEGVDRTWIEAGDRRQAFYTRLGPGKYRFQVIAANNDGVWNATGASLLFEIPPTFLQSGWFVLLCAVAAALALWLIYSLRMRQVMAAIQSRHEERMAERERIARELHDTLLQGFQGLTLRFQAIMEGLPPGSDRREMDAALERADEVLISGRDSVRHIRRLSSAGDLGQALTDAAQARSKREKARFQLVVEGKPRGLHPVVAEELAAIGREAILNASRHSHGRSINAGLIYDRRGLTMSIADDGVGLDADVLAAGSRAGHFGLLGMRERADKIEAKLTLSSRPGMGVKIEVFVPGRVAFATAQREAGVWRRLRGALKRRAPG